MPPHHGGKRLTHSWGVKVFLLTQTKDFYLIWAASPSWTPSTGIPQATWGKTPNLPTPGGQPTYPLVGSRAGLHSMTHQWQNTSLWPLKKENKSSQIWEACRVSTKINLCGELQGTSVRGHTAGSGQPHRTSGKVYFKRGKKRKKSHPAGGEQAQVQGTVGNTWWKKNK